ncbi:M16 family metallopeptidase [Nitrospirillum viridazoti]|uniref:Peptidase M16 n=1 Tax=Nitrospirillum viridazoti CBAmc TaxID=1441467 RepID=A0A248JWR3_9PROT|nr:pitrilysin family protein [Nitrospirillum amazonense]ASG22634.1 peptidase M16 [Nitrospirillum amazonense CBAmc]TWB42794.1 zinc protease [Nitrospirillum amazonense]
MASGKTFLAAALATSCALSALMAPVLVPAVAHAADQPKAAAFAKAGKADLAAPKAVTSVEGITEYRLANGLRVLLFPSEAKSTITVNVVYRVGSRMEGYGETGMAHLLEHMMFKGTPDHHDIPQETQKRGFQNNATTAEDRTNYYETFDARQDYLDWALGLEADRMVHSFVARKDLDSEMTVVRNEMEMRENNPVGILMERMHSTAYLWHHYGHSTIGARSDVENVDIGHLQAFYHRYYRPDNATLVIAGKFDPAKALASVQAAFGGLKNPAEALPPEYTVEPAQDGERSVTLRRVGDTGYEGLAYHIPAATHPDSAALSILSFILGSTPSGRLHKALVEQKLATGVSASAEKRVDPGLAMALAEVPKGGDAAKVLSVMTGVVEGVHDHPITDEEVDRAKTRMLKNYDQLMDNPGGVALSLTDVIAQGDWRLLFVGRDRIAAVTTADVQRVAETYFRQANRTEGHFIPTTAPERVDIPAAPTAASLVDGYKGRDAAVADTVFDSSPTNIDAHTQRLDLPDGGKLALLAKPARGQAVNLLIRLRYGDDASLTGKDAASEAVASMLLKGTAKHSRQQIADLLDKMKANLAISSGTQQTSIAVRTDRAHVAEVLALVAEILREPAFPADELEQWRAATISDLESSRTDPQSLASNAFDRAFDTTQPDHPGHIDTVDEWIAKIKALKLEEVKAFYHAFYGARGAQVSVVGDFDAAAMPQLVQAALGGFVAPQPYTRIPETPAQVAGLDQVIQTPDKANAILLAGLPLAMTEDDPDYPALLMANRILGGSTLHSRLGDRVRQKEGLSYGAGSALSVGAIDHVGRLTLQAIAAPQNVAKVKTAFGEELARLVHDGVSDQELAEAKSGFLDQFRMGRTEDARLASLLATNLYLGRTMAWSAEMEAKVAAVTPAQVASALRARIDPDKLSYFRAGDFAKATN